MTERPGVVCRAMRDGDAPRVAELAGELGYPSTPKQILERKAVLDREGRHGLFVAESESGEVLGWVIVSEMCSLELDPNAEVKGLVVAESARGRGIGAELMRVAETWARARGLREVVMRSNVIRERTHAFYKGIGYEEQKRQVKFRKALR
ncbi:MAG TPA: GNAT family N-acetyltransferase [Candidatus Eisenbacteria bacterium]|nr:GNAT family N-acetyltransferase [Candidatus Eisenbacteria bacterium]